jgi:hypothetical protein
MKILIPVEITYLVIISIIMVIVLRYRCNTLLNKQVVVANTEIQEECDVLFDKRYEECTASMQKLKENCETND